MKKTLTVVMITLLAAMLMLTGCGKKGTEPVTEVDHVTPTFMYFVSNSDENFDETQKTIAELEKEYDGDVIFSVINIDENTEAATNFPVQGQTPMLIMLNTNNDISAMSPKCSDKGELKEAIEAALK